MTQPRKPRKAPAKKASKKGKKRSRPAETTEARIDRIAYYMIKGEWAHRRIPGLARLWGISTKAVANLADRAGVKIELSSGKLEKVVQKALLDLDAVQRQARKAKQFTAAVRAIEAGARLVGAFSAHRPGRGRTPAEEAPRGLPPELAQLQPPPSREEVEHFANTDEGACTVEACRIHGKAAPAADAVH